jgi:hypothetical protein
MAFGRIVQGLVRAGGAGTTATVTHNLNNVTHCTFGVQDQTNYGGGAGTMRTLPRFWTQAKGVNADTIQCDTVAGACQMSFMSVAPHHLLDVGPVTVGITRTVTSPFVTATKPAARSLHTTVPLVIQNGQTASAAVTITHNLNTASVIVIAFPTSDPLCTTAATLPPMVVVQNLAAATANTCEIQGQTQNFIVTSAGPNTVNFDVMVLARKTQNAPWSRIMRQHANAGVASDDYGAGARQLLTNPDLSTAAYPSYGALYTNVDDIAIGAAGTVYTHNMGASALAICFVEQTEVVGAAYNTMAIMNSATSTATMTILRGNEAGIATLNARLAIFRPYSWVCLPT